MPSSKKRETRSTTTLHRFFDSSSTKQKVTPQHSHKKASPSASSSNVIVIDSDSEEEPQVIYVAKNPGRKRRSFSESSGEVEIVDLPQTPVDHNIISTKGTLKYENKKRASGPSQNTKSSGEFRKAIPGLPRQGERTAFASFGTPSLLVNKPTIKVACPLNDKVALFGQPGPLLRSQPQASSSRMPPPDVDEYMIDVDDDWRTGDDEALSSRSTDNWVGDDFEVAPDALDSKNATISDVLSQCSRCGKGLHDWSPFDIQMHINQCFETSGSPRDELDTSTTPAMSESLKLLSSVMPARPHGPQRLISCDGKQMPRTPNAFSMLMSSRKDNEAWKEASIVEDQNFRAFKGNGSRRKAPFYKILQGMPIAVDAFRYGTIPGVTAYFLTHAHSDHYTNLSSTWKSGPIYCSEGTANLIIHMLSVDREWVHPLPMDTPTIIPGTQGVCVTLIEANHCPGSCLFYFEGPQTVNAGDSTFRSPFVGSPRVFRYLHCGDFRASPKHVLHPAVKGNKIDHVYLDTTYLNPKYSFPPQPLVISACAELARRLNSGESVHSAPTVDAWINTCNNSIMKPKTQHFPEKLLFIVGTYSIGKERIVKAIARTLNTKIYCDSRKAALLRCQADPELESLLSSDPLEANVHVVPLGLITSDKLKVYVEKFKGRYTKAVGFRPTGWTYTQPVGFEQLPSISTILSPSQRRDFTHANLHPARNSSTTLQLYSVPYSEHSSFYELNCFAMSFDWGKMIATVNVGSEVSRGKMAKWVAKWEAERKKRGKVELVPHRHPDYW